MANAKENGPQAPIYLGGPSFQSQVIQAFANTGATAIGAKHVPAYASLRGMAAGRKNKRLHLYNPRYK